MALSMTQQMNQIYGNNYTAINSAELCKLTVKIVFIKYSDPAAGCSDDYAKSLGVEYVYTMELTTGYYNNDYVGFETPKEMIEQTFNEVRAALVYLLRNMQK